MHSSTLSMLRVGIRQAERSIAQHRLLLTQTKDAAVHAHLEASIQKLSEILDMHVRTEQTLARNQQIARRLTDAGAPLDDAQLDRLCDEAMSGEPAARLSAVPR